jgi:hypothetical protein
MPLDAATACTEVRKLAGELGVVAEPEVIADRSNLVLRLGTLVARVAMATSTVRVGMEWLQREVELTRFLADRGGLVTQPSSRIEPGPYERAGLVISFWELEEIVAERADATAAGTALRTLHAELTRYEGRLPVWGSFDEARQVFARARTNPLFERSELALLESAWDRAEGIVESARARTASFQTVHGDAHIGNVMATKRGAVWTDWEDAFIGPVEWDLACLRSKAELFGEETEAIDAMTLAYGTEWNAELARDLGLVRNVQVIVWLAVFAERHPDLVPRMRARVSRLPT